jgi:DNA-binding MarR family transcriptional regulator
VSRAEVRLANQSWEALFQAQTALARSFTADDIWDEVSPNEYDVLYTLSKADGGLRLCDINRRVLITQAGMSKLINRLEDRGFVERSTNPTDKRAALIVLTRRGTDAQKRVGRAHAQAVTNAMTRTLSTVQLEQLRDLCRQITAVVNPELLENTETERTSS